MRMMMRVTIPVEAGNKALKEEVIAKLNQQTVEAFKPEAVYFSVDHGVRTGYFFFEMTSSSQLVQLAEPWMFGCNAKVEVIPVMNGDDLRAGIAHLPK